MHKKSSQEFSYEWWQQRATPLEIPSARIVSALLEGLYRRVFQSAQRFRAPLKKYVPQVWPYIPSHVQLIAMFGEADKKGLIPIEERYKLTAVIQRLRTKNTRTLSGVAPITVLTKPWPCPGRCIFCPNDIRMPKSYVAEEPGAQRALMHRFHPYLQMLYRMRALQLTGHSIEKIELLILGGTWSSYTETYQRWFVYECMRACHEFPTLPMEFWQEPRGIYSLLQKGPWWEEYDPTQQIHDKEFRYNQIITSPLYQSDFATHQIAVEEEKEITWQLLEEAQEKNAEAAYRIVGLSVETRADQIQMFECLRMRRLGVTKVQIGVQTLDDKVSDANARDETIQQVCGALSLLRRVGFKRQVHMMPNLYGASPQSDIASIKKLFSHKALKPDEIKMYPAVVMPHTRLAQLYDEGQYTPYTSEVLQEVLSQWMQEIPAYCRITRVVRDLPSTTAHGPAPRNDLRSVLETSLQQEGKNLHDIRSREWGLQRTINSKSPTRHSSIVSHLVIETEVGEELFIALHEKDLLRGFVRILFPEPGPLDVRLPEEILQSALIREVHVYGEALGLHERDAASGQHLGVGRQLIAEAEQQSIHRGYRKIVVIAAMGTRRYYEKLDYAKEGLYHSKTLNFHPA